MCGLAPTPLPRVQRPGSLLHTYQRNVAVVHEPVQNDISSSKASAWRELSWGFRMPGQALVRPGRALVSVFVRGVLRGASGPLAWQDPRARPHCSLASS